MEFIIYASFRIKDSVFLDLFARGIYFKTLNIK